jgi:outer membrane lipoprotein-sorting protein
MKILFLSLIVFVTLNFGQSTKLVELQSKFKTIEDFSADFKQSVNVKSGLSGKIFYKKDKRLRLELKNMLILTDGVTSWNYNQRDNKVIISDYNEDDQTILSLNKIIFDYPPKCKVDEILIGDDDVIILTPKDNSLGFNSAKLWLNNNSLISKILIVDSEDSQILIEFSNYKVDQKISGNKFTFSVPEGCKIIDLR